ncbi:MAG: hypothetical protein A3I77_03875 [Gammaproteobacteria bacterium RIFCSPLOWO2_02_FULL_42_14]|nr:MAG: hypothetical protein A3B71_05180 [Gammaproteobacteria bacterium RIFCSPHIGHO2_02_FULL_42_43]OGT28551.1 MAG: hypothetical protein A2624_04030 [Gammaproteobacteria bacterium RIFCSPHIGHO2_01_FULL_42_8]OGT51392.1 MAG: hypothetical protein A3E54_04945 [Gammaproteobacteria bacterium RIFCSPHIGHO2_12_FULL_41_25]OGT62094.1 MAG: hypothetical protein A3I77_03875 [Gammaproteobacteria bacterium RIFCSPLOWO2_02_FULL_42_14]OGT85766.1 MAG: hypothetical protein A3G86_03570 [Gammaproteobacteria bacterium R
MVFCYGGFVNNQSELATKKQAQICEDGYAVLYFKNTQHIKVIQDQIKSIFSFDPVEFHEQKIDDDSRLQLIKKAKDCIVERQLVKNLLLDNIEYFVALFGPDIDIQSDVYLRISRPNQEDDFIDWHRDTFYGNSHWELNFWFPIFPLETGAGLMVVKDSHLVPADNISLTEEKNLFRKKVTKGSLANELGFLYAPKSDDTMSKLDQTKIKLLTPDVGQAIIFFAHHIHRAQNFSHKTRISIDLRIKSMLAPTNTRPGYYQSLIKGDIAKYVEKIYSIEKRALCGN